jgi:membrane dipeptidase
MRFQLVELILGGMKLLIRVSGLFVFAHVAFFCASSERVQKPEPPVNWKLRAEELAREFIIVDTHVDLPYRLTEKMEDVTVRTMGGDFDYVRAVVGGLDAPFMSIYVPASYEENGGAKEFADYLINMVDTIVEKSQRKFAVAFSVADVREYATDGIIAFPMGMENGAPIEGDLKNLKYFYDRGIRYITLAHSKSNHICDSSYDPNRKWSGVSPFGEQVIAEMNRLGIMIDVSHITDSAFYDVMRISKAPVIASHSSCRYFTPGWERNMSDEMIQLMARKGGIIHINFGSAFLREDIQKQSEREWLSTDSIRALYKDKKPKAEVDSLVNAYRAAHPTPYADIADVIAHINHVVKLVGVDHVGLGSDFDGVGDSLPTGLKDVSYLPNLIYELMKAGYSENDIRKICGENTLRVWSHVENIATEIQSRPSAR